MERCGTLEETTVAVEVVREARSDIAPGLKERSPSLMRGRDAIGEGLTERWEGDGWQVGVEKRYGTTKEGVEPSSGSSSERRRAAVGLRDLGAPTPEDWGGAGGGKAAGGVGGVDSCGAAVVTPRLARSPIIVGLGERGGVQGGEALV